MNIATLVLAAISTSATVSSMNQQKKAAKAQRQQQQVQARRSQRQAVREQQILRAQSQAQAGAFGIAGGSGFAGGMSSLSSQLGGNIGTANQLSGLSDRISIANSKSATLAGFAKLTNTFSSAYSAGAFNNPNNTSNTNASSEAVKEKVK